MFYFLEFISTLIFFAGIIFLFRKKLKRSRTFVTGLSVVLLISSVCSGVVLYAIPMPKQSFRIEATGDKNVESDGNTIALKSVIADGREYPIEAPIEGTWLYSQEDGAYLWVDENDERWTPAITRELIVEVPVGEGRQLVFLAGNEYGVVRVSYDGVNETQDLYRENNGRDRVKLPDSSRVYDNVIKLCRLGGYNLLVFASLALAVWLVKNIEREELNKLIYGILSLVAALTFFLNVKLTDRTGADLVALFNDFNGSFSGNFVLGIILFPMLYKAFSYCGELYRKRFSSARGTCCIALPAGVFALFMVLGAAFINGNNTLKPIFSNELQILKSLFALSGYFSIFFFGITWIFNWLENVDIYKVTTKRHLRPIQMYLDSLRARPFITTFITLFIGYLPILIISYPGIIMADVPDFMRQIYGASWFHNVHPVTYTWFLGLCMRIGDGIFHSANAGVFICALLQFLFSIIVVSILIKLFIQIQISNNIILLLIGYYLFHPRFQNYFMLVTKDIINAVFFLIFMTSLYLLFTKKRSRYIYVLLGISDLGVILFRLEGYYVIALSLLIISFLMRDFRKQTAVVLICTVFFMSIWKSILLPTLGVASSKDPTLSNSVKGDMFTAIKFIEVMQTARYIRDAGAEITEEEKKVISAYLDYDRIVKAYRPHIWSDDVTKLIKGSTVTQNDVMEYHRIWLQMFAKHPEIYLEGILNFKYQYLYPYTQSYNNSLYSFSFSKSNMSKINNYNLEGMSGKLLYPKETEDARNNYQLLRESFFAIPFFNLFFTTGSILWFLLMWLSYSIYRKNIISISIIMPLLCLIIPLILGPTNGGYFRYTYPYLYCLPPVIVLGLHSIKQQRSGEASV